jgi:hypothetical protein
MILAKLRWKESTERSAEVERVLVQRSHADGTVFVSHPPDMQRKDVFIHCAAKQGSHP